MRAEKPLFGALTATIRNETDVDAGGDATTVLNLARESSVGCERGDLIEHGGQLDQRYSNCATLCLHMRAPHHPLGTRAMYGEERHSPGGLQAAEKAAAKKQQSTRTTSTRLRTVSRGPRCKCFATSECSF